MQGGRSFAYGGARVEVLAPLAGYVAPETPRNNDSLVMRLSFGRNSFLLTGDVEKQVEAQLVADGILGRTDVLKVAHHGSKTSSTPDFLERLQPAFAIISAGFENSYGHPHPSVLERLAEHHIATFRTDRDGLITIRSDGRRLYIERGTQQGPRAVSLFAFF